MTAPIITVLDIELLPIEAQVWALFDQNVGLLEVADRAVGIDGELRFASSLAAFGAAQRCKAVSEIEDAWAFEVEQLRYVAQQKQAAMTAAASALADHDDGGRWFAMSKTRRVASLLKLGAVRNTLRLPMIQPPLFAAYARALHD